MGSTQTVLQLARGVKAVSQALSVLAPDTFQARYFNDVYADATNQRSNVLLPI
jgi:hypothetical protein